MPWISLTIETKQLTKYHVDKDIVSTQTPQAFYPSNKIKAQSNSKQILIETNYMFSSSCNSINETYNFENEINSQI